MYIFEWFSCVLPLPQYIEETPCRVNVVQNVF
jgi:hypothetical protein